MLHKQAISVKPNGPTFLICPRLPQFSRWPWLLHLHATYQPIPSIYPVGVTDFRLFKQKIGHNSVNLYWIPNQIGTEMHFNKPFIFTKLKAFAILFYYLTLESSQVIFEVNNFHHKRNLLPAKPVYYLQSQSIRRSQ